MQVSLQTLSLSSEGSRETNKEQGNPFFPSHFPSFCVSVSVSLSVSVSAPCCVVNMMCFFFVSMRVCLCDCDCDSVTVSGFCFFSPFFLKVRRVTDGLALSRARTDWG